MDVRTGGTRPLHTEKDEAWVSLHQDFPLWLEDGSGFLWHTEHNGGPEVELRKADGSLSRSLVPPGAGFSGLVGYLEKEETLYFVGGPNPTERYLWRVKKGEPPARVTSEAGGPALETGLVSRTGSGPPSSARATSSPA